MKLCKHKLVTTEYETVNKSKKVIHNNQQFSSQRRQVQNDSGKNNWKTQKQNSTTKYFNCVRKVACQHGVSDNSGGKIHCTLSRLFQAQISPQAQES